MKLDNPPMVSGVGDDQYASIGPTIKAHADRIPDAVAIVAPERLSLTYGQLYQLLLQTGRKLRDMGLERQDRIALALPNGPEMATAFLAVAAHATCAPLNPAYSADEFARYLADLQATALIVPAGVDSPARIGARVCGIPLIELSPAAEAEAGRFSLNGQLQRREASHGESTSGDIALVLPTSGTTSRPKIVPLTHANICTAAHHIGMTLHLSEHDRCLNVLPLFHAHALLTALLTSVVAGASVVLPPDFSVPQFFLYLAEFQPTWYSAVPAIHQAILAGAIDYHEIIAAHSLRFIRSASAPLPPRVLTELEAVFQIPVIETYGMTEASAQITSNPLPPGIRKIGSVGIAAGPELKVADAHGTPVPSGVTGEVRLRGATLMRHYENPPDANETAFIDGWFCTGDQGHLDADGYLFITGRLKEIINRGGEKIAPREIDDVLIAHPAVAQAVTFGMPHAQLGEEIAAAIVLHPNTHASDRDIREFATRHLAPFKVPRLVRIVDAIPSGPTGKPHRLSLAETLGLSESESSQLADVSPLVEFVPPRNPLEQQLAAIWKAVLGAERAGIHDDFFLAGGDSILATQLLSRIQNVVGVALSFPQLFENATIMGIAQRLKNGRQTTLAPDLLALPVPPPGTFAPDTEWPLSLCQKRLWFFEQFESGRAVYHLPMACRLTGELNISAWEQSLKAIVQRHVILHTTFPSQDGQPIQRIAPTSSLTFSRLDLSALPITERKPAMQRYIATAVKQPFDLAVGPLWRATLIRLADRDHVFLMVLHHLIFDGWSIAVFWREFAALYTAACKTRPISLPDLPMQYATYAVWQQQWLQDTTLEAQLTYWRQQLGEPLPILELPTDHPRPPQQTFRGARHTFWLSRSSLTALKTLSQRNGVTLFMTLLAAFQTLLYRYTGQTDLVLGTPIAGRTRAEIETLIGFFVNTLVLRTELGGNPSFQELLQRVRRVAQDAYAHQELPFERLVERLQPQRDLSRNPLCQVMFHFDNTPPPEWDLPGLTVQAWTVDQHASVFDLTLVTQETAEGLRGVIDYSADLFDASTIARMAGHFQTLLEAVVINADQRLSTLPLLTEAERQQLLVGWNTTTAPYSISIGLHHLFARQAEMTPDRIAAIAANQAMTYHELDARSNQLAHYLQGLGIGPDVCAGLYLERSLELMVGVLGILKAGGAYVPLDPAYPAARLTFMLADAQVPVVLTQQSLTGRLPVHRARIVCLDTGWARIAQESRDPAVSGVTAANLAYVMYTSGSTGTPKGSMMPHQGPVNYLTWSATAYVGLTPGYGTPVHSSIGFDATLTSLFAPLLTGQPIVLLPEAEGIRALHTALRTQHEFSFVKVTPAHLELLGESLAGEDIATATGTVIVGGEALAETHLARWRHYAPRTRFVNEYGPTEATVGCCVFEVSEQTVVSGMVPIGRPIHNTQLYILDPHLQPVPIGVPGELYIGGDGLARGYLHHPEWTAEQFVPNPFSTTQGSRLYKTGDAAQYQPDGNLEFLGRLDDQVNLRGFRIELGEIEAVLRQCPGVREAVAVVREKAAMDQRLIAYVLAMPDDPVQPDICRGWLRSKLPRQMIPSAFVILEAFPLTPNGKVDRQALPAPEPTRPERADSYTAPRTHIEDMIAMIWQDVLQVDQVSIHDNFFDLGGHSLLVVQVHSRLHDAFNQALSVSILDLFTYPTIHTLALYLRQEQPRSTALPSSQERAANRRAARQRRRHLRAQPTVKHLSEDADEDE